jgi:hypothetical protein
MKNSKDLLVDVIHEVIAEQKVMASPEYMRKEKVREEIQNSIKRLVNLGFIKNQRDLESFFDTIPMVVSALKMVPIEAWMKIPDAIAKK